MALIDLLKRVSKLKAQLDTLRPISKEQEARIMQKFRLDWNFHSNHLEGNSLTYGETKALILFGITAQGKPLKDHVEIAGHDEAIKWIEDLLHEERPLTENFIRELNLLLLKEPYHRPAQTADGKPTTKLITPGQYKTQPNHVLTSTGEIFYFATPEETPAQMHDLAEWFRARKEDKLINPILLAAELHYKFIRIHPFDDGNGRTARILMNFILMQQGYPPIIIKTEDKQNYIATLRQADAGILDPFVVYVANNLIRSLEIMIKGAKGESIEDPDDLDKEIALLEQKLKGVGAKTDSIKSKEGMIYIYKNSIIPLIDNLIDKAQKFQTLYINSFGSLKFEEENWFSDVLKGVRLLPIGKSSENEGTEITPHTDLNIFQKEIIEKTQKISIVYNHLFFKNDNPLFMNFSFKEEIHVLFNYHNYRVETNNLVIEKKYNELLSDLEIKNTIEAETRRHTEAIEVKIREVQNLE